MNEEEYDPEREFNKGCLGWALGILLFWITMGLLIVHWTNLDSRLGLL